MNDFRDRILGGKAGHAPLLLTKRPSRPKSSKAAEQESFADVTITREATRQANHRDADRHRLQSEYVELVHAGATQEVALVNLSGGGAMIEGAQGLKLWDRVECRFDGRGLEAIVRWIRGDRFGMEFAHETRIEGGADEVAEILLTVIRRSFPDAELDLEAMPQAPELALPQPVEVVDFYNRVEREMRHPLIWSGMVHYDHDSSPVRLRNISSNGALIEVTVTYPVGAELLLDLREAGSLFATVHWARGDQCGLKFHAPFDINELARAKPEVASARWVAPDHLRETPGGAGPWDAQWNRSDLKRIREQLESTRSAIRP